MLFIFSNRRINIIPWLCFMLLVFVGNTGAAQEKKDTIWRVSVQNQYYMHEGEKAEGLRIFSLLAEELAALEKLKNLIATNNGGNLMYDATSADNLSSFLGAVDINLETRPIVSADKKNGVEVVGEIVLSEKYFSINKKDGQILAQSKQLLLDKQACLNNYKKLWETAAKLKGKEKEKTLSLVDNNTDEMQFLLLNEAANHNYICGDYRSALALYETLLVKQPDNINLLKNRAFALYDSGNSVDAISAFTVLLQKNPEDMNSMYYRANANYVTGNYEEAVADYGAVLIKDDKDGYAYYGRANAYKKKGNFDDAVADYTAAIVLVPGLSEARANRGDLYMYRQSYDLALDDYNLVIGQGVADAETYLNRGAILLKKGNTEAAIKDFDAAIALRSDYVDAYYNRALAIELILYNQQRNGQATKHTIEWLISAYNAFLNKTAADNPERANVQRRINELSAAIQEHQVEVLNI